MTFLLSFNIHMNTGYTSACCKDKRLIPLALARQSSITSRVDLPLWWQNKFQLRPCEIGFPRSIMGLRIFERFSRFCFSLLFFFLLSRLTTWAARQDDSVSQPWDLQLVPTELWQLPWWQSYEINKSLWTDFFFSSRKSRTELMAVIASGSTTSGRRFAIGLFCHCF